MCSFITAAFKVNLMLILKYSKWVLFIALYSSEQHCISIVVIIRFGNGKWCIFNINFLTCISWPFFFTFAIPFPLPFQVWAHSAGSRPSTNVCSETVGGPDWTQPCFCKVIQLHILCCFGFFLFRIIFFH